MLMNSSLAIFILGIAASVLEQKIEHEKIQEYSTEESLENYDEQPTPDFEKFAEMFAKNKLFKSFDKKNHDKKKCPPGAFDEDFDFLKIFSDLMKNFSGDMKNGKGLFDFPRHENAAEERENEKETL